MIRLSGVLAALVLPFTDDDHVDIPPFTSFVDSIVSTGAGGVVINADSGEGMSLWPEERRQVLKAAVGTVAGRIPVVSGLFASFTGQAVQLAEEAAADGADALLIFPNVHFRGLPLDPEVPLRMMRAVHESSGLPVVAFQLQDALGGVEWQRETLQAIVQEPYVVAIKESTFDAVKFRSCLDLVRTAAPDVAVLSGNDNFIFESFLLGADGSLMGAGSIATRDQVAMFDAVKAGRFDEAADTNERILPLMREIFKAPIRDYRARTKEALRSLGVFPSAAVREPLLPLADADRKALLAALDLAELR